MTIQSGPDHGLRSQLSDLANRFGGAVDSWTLVCLDEIPVDKDEFLRKQIKSIRDAVRSVTQSIGAGSSSELQSVVKRLHAACDSLEVLFTVLAHLKHHSPDEVDAAIRMLANTYADATAAIRVAAQDLAVNVPALESREHIAYLDGILSGLSNQFAIRRQRNEPALASQ
jgi:hypothetical protein